MADAPARIEAIVSDFGGVLTTPLIQSFMAFQDRTGITTETLGKGMQAAAEANGARTRCSRWSAARSARPPSSRS